MIRPLWLRTLAPCAVLAAAALALAGCAFDFEAGVDGATYIQGEESDQEIRDFLDYAVPRIFSPYDPDELFNFSVPEVAQLSGIMEGTFAAAGFLTGDLKSFEVESGEIGLGPGNASGDERALTASYVLDAEFENGPGHIELDLIRRDGVWEIVSWNVKLGDR